MKPTPESRFAAGENATSKALARQPLLVAIAAAENAEAAGLAYRRSQAAALRSYVHGREQHAGG